MIVLDTNVVSELMRPRPDNAVLAWVDSRPASGLALTAVTAAELLYGVERLPPGSRRRGLAERVEAMVVEEFRGRVAAFDEIAAGHYAQIMAGREAAGRPMAMADGQIAAICRSLGATLATRNPADFAGTGIDLLEPWTAPHS